jgi:DNA adenine methylase
MPNLPGRFARYFEPFCGGAALFFALQPERALLSDANAELIHCYRTVSRCPERVIGALMRMRNTEQAYYAVRDERPTDSSARAARFIYLCRFSFNGIYRVNLRGQFNVPYGHKTHMPVCEPEHILKAARALQRAELARRDFEEAVAGAVAGDLVYFDPPYAGPSVGNGFVKYNPRLFSWEDQKRLASMAQRLLERGCHVLVSNALHPAVSALYPGFREIRVTRHSVIAAAVSARRRVGEALFVGKPGG